jgi:histidinol-phosphate aminotransferase
MKTSRRNWIKQVGLGITGLSIAPLTSFATPTVTYLEEVEENDVLVRLRSNENPYGPSLLARKAMAEAINNSNRYSWEQTVTLIAALAKKNKVLPENILMGAGSTEILDLAARYAALKKGSYVIAEPTYDYWTATACLSALKKIKVPLTKDKHYDLPGMIRAIKPDTCLVYICNPNNPTGTICDNSELESFINEVSKHTLVVVDEAYIDFTSQESMGHLVAENKNLIIVKTFSKIYGLAGARVGYALAQAETIEQLSFQQSSPNGSVSAVSVAGALASLTDKKFVQETYDLIEKARNFTITELEQLYISCIPSCTNFLYFSLDNYKKDFFQQLKDNHIIGTKIYQEEGKWSRITIGTMKEMQKFINALR